MLDRIPHTVLNTSLGQENNKGDTQIKTRQEKSQEAWPRAYKTFFMLNSVEHEFFLLINVKMPTIVGILTFMSWKNSTPGLSETEKC